MDNVILLTGSFFFLMIRRPPRSTLDRSSAASDVYKRQAIDSSTVIGIVNNNGGTILKTTNRGQILYTAFESVSYTHLRAHETVLELVCRLLLEKKKKTNHNRMTYAMTDHKPY